MIVDHQDEKGGCPVETKKEIPADLSGLVAVLAVTLEGLATRVSRDLDADAADGTLPDDPFWADTVSRLADYARECVGVLNEPEVTAVLAAYPGPLPPVPSGS